MTLEEMLAQIEADAGLRIRGTGRRKYAVTVWRQRFIKRAMREGHGRGDITRIMGWDHSNTYRLSMRPDLPEQP